MDGLVQNLKDAALAEEWDKTFPKSEKVNHGKATFHNRYGITLAERGFLTLAFDPSFTGESGGQPRYVASPDINTEDFMAAVDFLSLKENVAQERIGIIGICGWGGMALNAAALDTRIKAAAWLTQCRSYHPRSLNSNGGWNVTGCQSFLNMPLLQYSNEIRSAVMVIHGDKAHSCYFGKDAYAAMIQGNKYKDNKELLLIPGASHTDLYDRTDVIPFDRMAEFFMENMK